MRRYPLPKVMSHTTRMKNLIAKISNILVVAMAVAREVKKVKSYSFGPK